MAATAPLRPPQDQWWAGRSSRMKCWWRRSRTTQEQRSRCTSTWSSHDRLKGSQQGAGGGKRCSAKRPGRTGGQAATSVPTGGCPEQPAVLASGRGPPPDTMPPARAACFLRRDLNQNVAGLLDELDIPRAISAPPHLDDRWAAQLVRRRRRRMRCAATAAGAAAEAAHRGCVVTYALQGEEQSRGARATARSSRMRQRSSGRPPALAAAAPRPDSPAPCLLWQILQLQLRCLPCTQHILLPLCPAVRC